MNMESDQLSSLLKEIECIWHAIDGLQCEHPYRLNVIDELHINENGHSRILVKLLQYRSDNGKYVFLESLLNYIISTKRKDFPNRVEKPEISQEAERIDMWVRDKQFALIMENKACGAVDQETQIFRYIEKTRNRGYTDEQIFVIYLPPTDDKEPSDDSWNGLKEEYTERYVKLSFREDIIKWIDNYVLPNICYKDNLLLTAIIQYCDYLKELFKLNNNDMENQIRDLFDKELALSGDLVEKSKQIDETIEKYQSVVNELSNYREELEQEFAKIGKVKIQEFMNNELQFASQLERVKSEYGGHKFQYEGKTLELIIGREPRRWFVQIQWSDETPTEERIFPNSIWKDGIIYRGDGLSLYQSSANNYIWKYCNTLEETFAIYKRILKHIVEINK